MLNDNLDVDPVEEYLDDRRLANIVSVLVPAREYALDCAWTTERPLPAIEEFSCKLLLILDELKPSELQRYFGLSVLELSGLITSLNHNRLVELCDDGMLRPTSILSSKKVNGGGVPTLTAFETRQENAVLDLLTLQLVPRRTYSNSRFGLPEIPIPESSKSLSMDRVVESFSEQYRAFLDFSKGRSAVSATRLYKVSRCAPRRTVQVPIDMEVTVEVGSTGDFRVLRDAVERLGDNRRRPLSNELEARIADYLASEELTPSGGSFKDFCEAMDDEVLARYVQGSSMDLGAWLLDRKHRRTGYGSTKTTGLLGPIYLPVNRKSILRNLHDVPAVDSASAAAYWLAADVPFWASNSSEIAELCARMPRALSREPEGKLVAIVPIQDRSAVPVVHKKFQARLPNVAFLRTQRQLGRMELLWIPGRLAVAQFHIQPVSSSAITIPVGLLTTEPSRVANIGRLLMQEVRETNDVGVVSPRGAAINDLLDPRLFGGEAAAGAPPQVTIKTPMIHIKKRPGRQ